MHHGMSQCCGNYSVDETKEGPMCMNSRLPLSSSIFYEEKAKSIGLIIFSSDVIDFIQNAFREAENALQNGWLITCVLMTHICFGNIRSAKLKKCQDCTACLSCTPVLHGIQAFSELGMTFLFLVLSCSKTLFLLSKCFRNFNCIC